MCSKSMQSSPPLQWTQFFFCIDRNLANKCQPWLLYTNFISSGLGTSSQTAAILELSLPFGFIRSTEGSGDEGDLIVRDPPIPDTHLRVEFEVVCSALCQLVLKQSRDGQRDVEIMSWNAGQTRQNYTYWIKSSQPVKFYWVFEKNVAKDTKDLTFLHDHVRIYQIEVTNAKNLSVIGCRTCLKGVENGKQVIEGFFFFYVLLVGCVTCPPGLFYESRLNETTHQEVINCTACPVNTVVVSDAHSARSVPEACIPCEPGTKAINHSVCVIDTMPTTTNGMFYNLTNLLSRNRTIQGTKLFTSSGLPYRYEYHLTLNYGDHVHCLDTLNNGVSYAVESLICRHTTVWESTMSQNQFYTQPLSLADRLIKAIPTNYSKEFWSEVNANLTRAGWTRDDIGTDLHYIFNTYASSINCPHGRWSVVTFRCGLAQDMWFANFLGNDSRDVGTLELPPACPAGTCDGCVYHFMWTSILACPICSPTQFQRFYGECKYGTRYVYLTAPEVCRIPRGIQMREIERCPLLTAGQYVALFLTLSIFLILGFVIFICHRRNKKLEYKYMKLIQSQEGRGQPTSCALDEHEEDSVDSFGRRSVRQSSNTNAHMQLEPTSVTPVKATNPVISVPKLQLPILGPILFKKRVIYSHRQKNDDQDRQPLPENEVIG
ncbi:hypothetical protein P879_05906 [Paragonimus westermani]|uniref:MRH domain-containing protein n=1 Tax=Paragonimus westermani TaxID=34504 RepID=A0A8T0D7U0_9TREM|nr:hypothetical protein P879_05906 [Paragonimus westermani]